MNIALIAGESSGANGPKYINGSMSFPDNTGTTTDDTGTMPKVLKRYAGSGVTKQL